MDETLDGLSVLDRLDIAAENGANMGVVLDLMNQSFQETVEWKNADPENPFLWWRHFKEKKKQLARGLIRVGNELTTGEAVDAVVTLPESATWLSDHIRPGDFGGAKKFLVLRQQFGGVPIGVRSYTKNSDGTMRKERQPRQKVNMYADFQLIQGLRDEEIGTVLILDDVAAEKSSLEDVAEAFKGAGAKRIIGVVGVAKLMQLRRAEAISGVSFLDEFYACVQVERIENRKPVVTRWWEGTGV